MDALVRTENIDRIVMMAYYWLSEDNYNCACNLHSLLSKLKLNSQEKKKVEDLGSDIKNMATSKKVELSLIELIDFPENIKKMGEDMKLLHVAVLSIMNLFNVGNFELGYTFLMEMADGWTELYTSILPMIKESPFKDQLVEWALTHFLFAKDIAGNAPLSIGNYVVVKKS